MLSKRFWLPYVSTEVKLFFSYNVANEKQDLFHKTKEIIFYYIY